ncbi:hypothetical protein Tco_0635699 [Tanacetum coccineum]
MDLDFVTLLTRFVRALVTRTRVHGFQMGLKSYQHRLNLTKPIITVPVVKNMEACTLMGEAMLFRIIYLNINYEKCFMGYKEIHKFYTSTLERVKREIAEILVERKYGCLEPTLNEHQKAKYEELYEAVDKRSPFRVAQIKRMEGFIRAWDMKRGGQ